MKYQESKKELNLLHDLAESLHRRNESSKTRKQEQFLRSFSLFLSSPSAMAYQYKLQLARAVIFTISCSSISSV